MPVHVTKADRGGVDMLLQSFINSALDGGDWSSSGTAHFPPGQERRNPLNERLGEPQSRPESCGEKKQLNGNLTKDHQARGLFIIPTMLSGVRILKTNV